MIDNHQPISMSEDKDHTITMPTEDPASNTVHVSTQIASPEVSEMAGVTVKVPPFWKEKPELWFIQVESQFFMARVVSDSRKYHTVIAAIESSVLGQVSDVLLNPPAENKYENLKKQLISRLTDSDHHRLRKLLQEIELGDRKPSQLLREMRHLAGSKMDDELLKSLWLQRLPANMRSIISVSSEDLNKLTELADKIAELSDVPQVFEVNGKPHPTASASNGIEHQISELTRAVAELKANFSPRSRSRSRTTSFNQSRRSSRRRISANNDGSTSSTFCWYHRKHGVNARNCRAPCTFKASLN